VHLALKEIHRSNKGLQFLQCIATSTVSFVDMLTDIAMMFKVRGRWAAVGTDRGPDFFN
jgi:hypothetical protein